jgi:hypothetical protein
MHANVRHFVLTLAILLMAMALSPAMEKAAAAPAPGSGKWGYSGIYGPLYPGKIIWGEPVGLPPAWRAYPLSIFGNTYVIYPDRRRIRVNFRPARSVRKARPSRPRRR